MRIVFMGTPEFSVPTLAEIVGAGHDVAAVYTRAPKPAGRGMDERRSPVHDLAATLRIPVFTPKSLRTEDAVAQFAAHEADVAVVVAYGLILPKPILDAPRLGCLNLHASALPRWRGAAPIQRAIMAGDAATAVMVMRMEEGLDTGPVCMSEPVVIAPDMTAGELHDRLMTVGGGLMVRALAALDRDSLTCAPQSEAGITYAAKIDKAEARIDFARPAAEVHNLIRGLSPFPGAWFELPGAKPERIKVLRATLGDPTPAGTPGEVTGPDLTVACGDGRAVRLLELQRAGKKPMAASDLLRGLAIPAGTRLHPVRG